MLFSVKLVIIIFYLGASAGLALRQLQESSLLYGTEKRANITGLNFYCNFENEEHDLCQK